jgi:N-acetylglutamate synthase-like GNAT family acetyltransferase
MPTYIKQSDDTQDLLTSKSSELEYSAELIPSTDMVAIRHLKVSPQSQKSGIASTVLEETESFIDDAFPPQTTVLVTITIKDSDGTVPFLRSNGFSGLSKDKHEDVYTATKTYKTQSE